MATDYEQKYKGALERAKKFKDKYGGDYAGYIFPELAESEDERIRKKMIEHFKSKTKDTWCNMPVKSILAWLEKQKEQKLVDYEHEMWKNCEANFEGGKKEVIEHPEKYGLQKPAEWSEEDSDNLERVDNYLWMLDNYVGDDCATPQGKVDKIRENIQEVLSPWLKSLPERFVLQPKQEWSDEEKEILDSILSHYVLIDKPIDANGISKEKYISLIKSIRFDTYKNCNSHWKPSEEQMEALERASTNKYLSAKQFDILVSLYEQLKKLM